MLITNHEYPIKNQLKMKNILTIIAVIFTANLFAQSHEIIKHNGEKLEVNFIKAENNLIYYSLPTSTEEQKISKYAVAQLNDKAKASSKKISENIVTTEQSDYKKVVILKESETIGLNKSEELIGFIGKVKGQPYYELNKIMETNLQKKAASKGVPFIVFVSKDPNNLKAIAFKY